MNVSTIADTVTYQQFVIIINAATTLSRSKSCPQCRHKATEKSLVKLFFDSGGADTSHVDPDTLQHQIDSLKVHYVFHYLFDVILCKIPTILSLRCDEYIALCN